MQYDLDINKDPNRIGVGDSSDISLYSYLELLLKYLRHPSLEITEDLFQIYLAATPNYIGPVDKTQLGELTYRHKAVLERFILFNIENRKCEAAFIAAVNTMKLGTNKFINRPPEVSEDTAKLLRDIVLTMKRLSVVDINQSNYISMLDNKITGLYLNLVQEFDSTTHNRVRRSTVEVDPDDYFALYFLLMNSKVKPHHLNNTSTIYKLLFIFVHLHFTTMTYHIEEWYSDRVMTPTPNSMASRIASFTQAQYGVYSEIKNPDAPNNQDWPKYQDYRLVKAIRAAKRYRGYAHLDQNSLLAMRYHLDVPSICRKDTVHRIDNEISLFLSLQHHLYQGKVRQIEKRANEPKGSLANEVSS